MVNAQYGRFKVKIHHNGQFRTATLHVVELPAEKKFFLFDDYGWAIDDARTVEAAVLHYVKGAAEEIVE